MNAEVLESHQQSIDSMNAECQLVAARECESTGHVGHGEVRFDVEAYSACLDEIRCLLPAHYSDTRVDPIPLEIDFDKYCTLEAADLMHVVTARCDGALVGYYTSIVMPHIQHMHSLTAYPDMLYLQKPYRNGFTVMRMFRTVEETLSARGVQRMFTGVTLSHDFGPLLDRMGFKPIERLYSKMLG